MYAIIAANLSSLSFVNGCLGSRRERQEGLYLFQRVMISLTVNLQAMFWKMKSYENLQSGIFHNISWQLVFERLFLGYHTRQWSFKIL